MLGPATAALIALADREPRQDPSCQALIRRTMDLAERYPDLAKLYAAGSRDELPRLANSEERHECGDPIEILRALGE